MEFTDITGKTWQTDCMGCGIANSTATPPGGIIAENASFCLHQDPLVPIEGFLVIGSSRHVRSLTDLTTGEYEDLTSLLRYGRGLMGLILYIQSVTVVQEENSQHLHMWLFPWYAWMIEKLFSVK
jgi:diadenosine tetraphosphate (Ap4A) HIT family hydrolase